MINDSTKWFGPAHVILVFITYAQKSHLNANAVVFKGARGLSGPTYGSHDVYAYRENIKKILSNLKAHCLLIFGMEHPEPNCSLPSVFK